MKRAVFTIIVTLFTAIFMAGCGPQQGQTPANMTEVNLLVLDNQIVPGELSVKPGSKIRFFLANGTKNKMGMVNDELGIKLEVAGEKTESLDWTAPETKGVYEVHGLNDGQENKMIRMKLSIEDPHEKNLEQNKQDQINIQ